MPSDKFLGHLATLRNLLNYAPETGKFLWLPRGSHCIGTPRGTRIFNSLWAGKEAGSSDSSGHLYIDVTVLGLRRAPLHRLAWAFVYQDMPEQIDHINGIPSDNRIVNLRAATPLENHYNAGLRKDNKSGVKGVRWSEKGQKWLARIRANSKEIHLGSFDSKLEAALAYDSAAVKLHKKFARTNAMLGLLPKELAHVQ